MQACGCSPLVQLTRGVYSLSTGRGANAGKAAEPKQAARKKMRAAAATDADKEEEAEDRSGLSLNAFVQQLAAAGATSTAAQDADRCGPHRHASHPGACMPYIPPQAVASSSNRGIFAVPFVCLCKSSQQHVHAAVM